jgi:hypothetical protein
VGAARLSSDLAPAVADKAVTALAKAGFTAHVEA